MWHAHSGYLRQPTPYDVFRRSKRKAARAEASSSSPSLSKEALQTALKALPAFAGASPTREQLCTALPLAHAMRKRRSASWPKLASAVLEEERRRAALFEDERRQAVLLDEERRKAALSERGEEQQQLWPATQGKLRPYQLFGVEFLLSRRGALLGDDMGLGKTAQALVALSRLPGTGPAVVVSPNFLKLNWEREAAVWLPGRTVHVLHASTSSQPWPPAHVYCINYDILNRYAQRLRSLFPRALIFDESQYIKNPNAKRSEAAVELAASVRARPGTMVLLLSGTPILNRPVELLNQLNALGVSVGGLSGQQFKDRYCDPQKLRLAGGRTVVTYDGATHVEELHTKLTTSGWFLRRLKRHVLSELPPKSYAEVVVSLTSDARKGYNALAKTYAESDDKLGVISSLRSLLARLKLQPVVEWVSAWLESTTPDRKIIVFAHHTALVDGIADAFGGLRIRGCDSTLARQSAVDAFQRPGGHRVIACNTAGVGLTLTAAGDLLFAEQAWAPASNAQAEDRAHRIGQAGCVTVTTLVAANTFDDVVAEVLARKRVVVDGVIDGVLAGGAAAAAGAEDSVAQAVARSLEQLTM